MRTTTGATDDALAGIAGQLTVIAEQLSDLAIDRLRAAVDPEDPSAEESARLERRITRARRSVEKAAALLDGAG
jgi:hypothetical protein